MKTYFYQAKLEDGRWVNVVYNSDGRKGTSQNHVDRYMSASKHGVRLASLENRATSKQKDEFTYLMNAKNKYEQCFDDYEVIDCRN